MKINIASLSQFKKWFKEELKIRLFECKDFNQFWIELITKVDFERLEKKFEDQLVEKYLREKELVSKQIRQMEAEREALKKELEESEQNRKAQSRLRILKTGKKIDFNIIKNIYSKDIELFFTVILIYRDEQICTVPIGFRSKKKPNLFSFSWNLFLEIKTERELYSTEIYRFVKKNTN